MVVPALVLATAVQFHSAGHPVSPGPGVRAHAAPRQVISAGSHWNEARGARREARGPRRHGLGLVPPTDWDLLIRAQYVRHAARRTPHAARLLEPGLLLHRAGPQTPHWRLYYVQGGTSWVYSGNVRPAEEPKGWGRYVIQFLAQQRRSLQGSGASQALRLASSPGPKGRLPRPRVSPPPSPLLPPAATGAGSAPTAPAATQPVPVAPALAVQPMAPQPVYGTDPASIEQEVTAAGDQAFGPGQGVYMANVVRYESGFNIYAINPSSGAAGLFQAYPASKLGCDLSDVQCQLNWGIGYIRSVYGTPAAAWYSEQTRGWY